MIIEQDTVVSFHYAVRNGAGEIVDSSEGRDPLSYVHGHGRIIPGLEQALAGHAAGDAVSVEVAPEQAYGAYDPALDIAVPLDAFPAEMQAHLNSGLRFRAEHPSEEGREVVFTIHRIEEGRVLASANHPLAGETLSFQVEITGVRAATADDLSEGQGCCGGGSCGEGSCGEGGCGEGGCGDEGCGCG